MLTPDQQKAVDQICGAAWETCRPDFLLAAFTASQAIFESAYLTRAPGNNCFGIKLDGHGTGAQYVMTHEYLNGQWKEMPLEFEAYASLESCFADHARLIQAGVYAPAWEQYQADHDIDTYIRGVSEHYATDPNYADQMIAETHSQTVSAALMRIAALNAV